MPQLNNTCANFYAKDLTLNAGRQRLRCAWAIRPVFHECAETRVETPKMMCLLRIYFCSRKRLHGNDPYHLLGLEFSAR